MRLQLTRLGSRAVRVLPLLCLAVAADAGDRVTSRVDVYRDDWVTTWVPQLRAEREGETWSVRAGAALDAVSGATLSLGPDVISSATRFDDRRWQGDLTVEHTGKVVTIAAGFASSVESDYAAHAPSVSVARELLDRTVTASARYSASFDTMRTSSGEPLRQRSLGHALDLGWNQILTRRTALSLSLSAGWLGCGKAVGCGASPYRYVPYFDHSAVAVTAHERHPDTHGRFAGNLRLSRSLGPAAVHAEYGAYADTWKVRGQLARVVVAGQLFDEQLLLGGDARGATQSRASFFEDAYATTSEAPAFTPYRTVDPELGGLRDAALGGRAEWSFYDLGPLLRLGVSARAERVWFRYPAVSDRPAKEAWIAGGGIDAEF